ncbi:MAG: hypothetical protein K6T66_06620 [Peptococcaceae bacterium]|nr:hypothetical protein [Peptococcaceae bacterium]
MKAEFVFESGYWWHVPCAVLDQFPRYGKMVPVTILTDDKRVYACDKCGKVAREIRKPKRRKR